MLPLKGPLKEALMVPPKKEPLKGTFKGRFFSVQVHLKPRKPEGCKPGETEPTTLVSDLGFRDLGFRVLGF